MCRLVKEVMHGYASEKKKEKHGWWNVKATDRAVYSQGPLSHIKNTH